MAQSKTRGGVMATMAAACDVLLAGFGRAMRYGRLAFHGGPDDRLTRARDGAHPAHMIPALIGVALVILLIASKVADDEEEERRSAAGAMASRTPGRGGAGSAR